MVIKEKTDILDFSEHGSKDEKLGDKSWYVVNTYSTHEKRIAAEKTKKQALSPRIPKALI